MLAVGCAVRVLGGGFHLYGFTVFFLPISQELGLTRAATSLVFSLARAEGAIEGPVAGYMLDRFGPRPVILTAIILSGLGYALLSMVDGYASFLVVYLGVISLSFATGFMHSPMAIANTWFIRRRAFAMTLISASIGIGGTLLTPLLAVVVHTWGWRNGALLAGIAMLILGIPLALSVRRSPESMGLLPDGDAPPKPGTSGEAAQLKEVNFTAGQAMRTTTFWMLVAATFARVTGFGTMMVHFVPVLVWKGLSEQRAAVLLAAFALLSLPAHLLLGWLADFVNKPRLMCLSMLIGMLSLVALLYGGTGEWSLWMFAILFTTVEAIFPVSWATVGDYFGRKHFATIRGMMSFFYMWGGVAAPVVAGAIYDRTQSYEAMMLGMIALFLVAAILYLFLPRPAPAANRPPSPR
jgi:sugar phosphate permease